MHVSHVCVPLCVMLCCDVQLLLGVAAFFFAATIALELSNYADFQIAFFHMQASRSPIGPIAESMWQCHTDALVGSCLQSGLQVKAVLASRIFTASVFCFKVKDLDNRAWRDHYFYTMPAYPSPSRGMV